MLCENLYLHIQITLSCRNDVYSIVLCGHEVSAAGGLGPCTCGAASNMAIGIGAVCISNIPGPIIS
jgi:hypothetical protein